MIVDNKTLSPLDVARRKLYEIAGGGPKSGDVRVAQLTTAQRIAYFQTPEFRDWVAFEKSEGRRVFWLKDVDKTQAAGDIFTFFFWWRVANNKLSSKQLAVIERFLLKRRNLATRCGVGLIKALLPHSLTPKFDWLGPKEVQKLWIEKENGGPGIGLLDFWSGVYWPTQFGMTEQEKLSQVREFAPTYAERVFPGVPEENRTLEDAGVHVVIVSNGDQELAIAAAPILGVKPENTVGSHLVYGKDGISTGVNHSYEVFDPRWDVRPQPGKWLSFHYWLYMNRQRLGWDNIDENEVIIAGRDGDSGSSDGGMMILAPFAALGNFIVDVPGEPKRIENFYYVADRYGFGKGKFFTLKQIASAKGRLP